MAGSPNPGAPIICISSSVENLCEYLKTTAEAARTARLLERLRDTLESTIPILAHSPDCC